MSDFSKFLNVDKNVLIEWIFDDTDFVAENYNVINNLNEGTRNFLSTTNLNKKNNNVFTVDEVARRYSKIDTEQFSFLQEQSYFSSNVPYNTVRFNFPTSFDFASLDYKGFIIRISTLDFHNKKIIPISNFFYDDTDINRQSQIQIRNKFLYNSTEWSKYIEFKIPDLEYVANQREVDEEGLNKPIDNTINYELTNGIGLSLNAPIFIEFAFITAVEDKFGIRYFTTTSKYNVSLPKIPEYQNLTAEVRESTQGDYFEIYGEWNGSNENFDDFIERLESRGLKIKVEYDVSLYEENILQRTQTFTISENFSQKIIYRPIIIFSNTTAIIDVEMRLIDIITNETIIRKTSLGLQGNNLLKYGINLTRINVDNIIKPKIYNLKSGVSSEKFALGSKSGFNKVVSQNSYPLLYEIHKIYASEGSSPDSSFKSMGNLRIVLSSADTVLKFVFAESITDDEIIYKDLSSITKNSKILIRFQTNDLSQKFEKEMFYEASNDLVNGVIFFKISESDLNSILPIYQKNKSFSIIIHNEISGSKQELYIGQVRIWSDIQYVDDTNTTINQNNTISTQDNNIDSFLDINNSDINVEPTGGFDENGNPTNNGLYDLNGNFVGDQQSNQIGSETVLQNMIVILNNITSKVSFENKLSNVVNPRNYSSGGQVYWNYGNTYFILSLTENQIEEILSFNEVNSEVSSIVPICIGQNLTNNSQDISRVNELVQEANDIFNEWILSAEFAGTGNPLYDPPTNTSKQRLILQVQGILDELKGLGYKLGESPNQNIMWNAVPDDGTPSHYIGI
jgi:hypothetical protein